MRMCIQVFVIGLIVYKGRFTESNGDLYTLSDHFLLVRTSLNEH